MLSASFFTGVSPKIFFFFCFAIILILTVILVLFCSIIQKLLGSRETEINSVLVYSMVWDLFSGLVKELLI